MSKSEDNPGQDTTDTDSSQKSDLPTLIPLWEVFIRPKNGLHHKHVGSLHATDDEMALQAARDVYTRRGEGNSIWVVPSAQIVASDPDFAGENFEPSSDKVYRHPSFYDIPDEVGHM